MKVNSQVIKKSNFIEDYGLNRPWIFLLGVIYFLIAISAITNPYGFPISVIDFKYAQFILSLVSFTLLFSIGMFLIQNNYRIIWGSSFLVYSLLFLGLSLESGLGFVFADMTNPILFFLWRTPMIIFVSGLWIGISSLFIENKKINYIPAFLLILIGESWFFFGLILLKNIEITMYVFLYGAFIPTIMSLAYLWYRYNKSTPFNSSSMVAIGFFLIGLIYTVWKPWYNQNITAFYFILFTLFNVALILILKGFSSLTKQNFQYGREE